MQRSRRDFISVFGQSALAMHAWPWISTVGLGAGGLSACGDSQTAGLEFPVNLGLEANAGMPLLGGLKKLIGGSEVITHQSTPKLMWKT